EPFEAIGLVIRRLAYRRHVEIKRPRYLGILTEIHQRLELDGQHVLVVAQRDVTCAAVCLQLEGGHVDPIATSETFPLNSTPSLEPVTKLQGVVRIAIFCPQRFELGLQRTLIAARPPGRGRSLSRRSSPSRGGPSGRGISVRRRSACSRRTGRRARAIHRARTSIRLLAPAAGCT